MSRKTVLSAEPDDQLWPNYDRNIETYQTVSMLNHDEHAPYACENPMEEILKDWGEDE